MTSTLTLHRSPTDAELQSGDFPLKVLGYSDSSATSSECRQNVLSSSSHNYKNRHSVQALLLPRKLESEFSNYPSSIYSDQPSFKCQENDNACSSSCLPVPAIKTGNQRSSECSLRLQIFTETSFPMLSPILSTKETTNFIPLLPLSLMNKHHVADTESNRPSPESIGFGFAKVIKTKRKTIEEHVEECTISRREDFQNISRTSSSIRSPGGSQGNDVVERPKTPFSKSDCVLQGKFSSDIKSPLAQNFPPISPYVRQSGKSMSYPSGSKYEHADAILKACDQKEPIPLNVVFQNLRNLKKVGEGVYGEAYIGHFGSHKEARVYKIVAVEGDQPVNGEKQKKFSEILPEIVVSQELTKLHDGVRECLTSGFVNMYAARVCKGKYPDALIAAWKLWHKENKSDNDCPDFKSSQLYVVFEFEFGGVDIEAFEFTNAKQTFSAVMQVAHIFAAGEVALAFEHRDAHWGNILVEDTPDEYVIFIVGGKSYKVPTGGIKVTIIDFTMSRITDGHGKAIFTDLADDEEQFLGTGDLQFDVYRMMREQNGNDWSQFRPKSNVFWIHYMADKMYFKGRYSNSKSMEHSTHLRTLQRLKDLIMDFNSCFDFVSSYMGQLQNSQ